MSDELMKEEIEVEFTKSELGFMIRVLERRKLHDQSEGVKTDKVEAILERLYNAYIVDKHSK